MATPLDKTIVRQSTEVVDDRNILIALTDDQRVSFRLKGMKSLAGSIPIIELYEQLTGKGTVKPKAVSFVRQEKQRGDELLVPMSRLRSFNFVTPGKPEIKQRLEELLIDFEEEMKAQSDFKNKKSEEV